MVIVPSVKKGAFGLGGSYGRRVMICRSGVHYTGPWGAPALYALEGIIIGFQLGARRRISCCLVMNPKGAESLLTSKVKLGADASGAAGPKGRTAEASTDVVLKKSAGLVGDICTPRIAIEEGASLKGSVLVQKDIPTLQRKKADDTAASK